MDFRIFPPAFFIYLFFFAKQCTSSQRIPLSEAFQELVTIFHNALGALSGKDKHSGKIIISNFFLFSQ